MKLYIKGKYWIITTILLCNKYCKQQKLSRRKLSWFSWIFDELQKFSLLIDRHHAIDIIMEAKSQKFSQPFHISYQTVKLFSRLTFVVYGMYFMVDLILSE